MIKLDLEHACLLELIKASLFGVNPVIPENANWEKLLDAAKAQCIVPLLVSYVPSEFKYQWQEISYISKAHYMQMLYEQNSLVKLFTNNDIPFVILKGTATAIYFPIPSFRTFGDIDIYIEEKHWDFAVNLLKTNGYRYLSNDVRHYEFEKNGMEFELHSRFGSKYYNDIEYILINGLKNAVEYKLGDATFPGLPTYENGLVLLGHIMQHLKASGIGLRQIIDWMMFVHNELDDTAWFDHFRDFACEAGLEKLAITVTYMCKKWLGLRNDITWCDGAEEEVADKLLIRVLDDGNLGHDRAPAESLKRSIKREGVIRYLYHEGVKNWPLAQKYVVLKPFSLIFQMCRYVGLYFSSLFSRRKVFMKDKNGMSLEELWKRLE